jgi:Fe-S-cluster containining protein
MRPTLKPTIRERVLAVYARAEREIAAAGPVCVASGRCCRFKEYGHTLFVSNLEAAVLLEGAPAYELPVTADFCPFQKEKLCTAREHRPLGCRVFYCDPTYQETGARITETYLGELKELANELGTEWRYAPLHQFLNQPALAEVQPRRE